MSKVKISEDERYPDYSISDYGLVVEATDEQVARWSAAAEAYAAAQHEMGELHDAAEAMDRARKQAEKVEREAREKAERVERSRQIEKTNARRRAAAEKMVGTVYDAEGNAIGEVVRGPAGLTAKPLADGSW